MKISVATKGSSTLGICRSGQYQHQSTYIRGVISLGNPQVKGVIDLNK